jgi:hypothetical protein
MADHSAPNSKVVMVVSKMIRTELVFAKLEREAIQTAVDVHNATNKEGLR